MTEPDAWLTYYDLDGLVIPHSKPVSEKNNEPLFAGSTITKLIDQRISVAEKLKRNADTETGEKYQEAKLDELYRLKETFKQEEGGDE